MCIVIYIHTHTHSLSHAPTHSLTHIRALSGFLSGTLSHTRTDIDIDQSIRSTRNENDICVCLQDRDDHDGFKVLSCMIQPDSTATEQSLFQVHQSTRL